VILAGRNAARYLRNGEVVEIPGPELFSHRWPEEIKGLGILEIYPNRDSLQYIDLYGIHGVRNMFRGTMRYPGWCKTLKAMADLGLLGIEERDWPAGTTHRDVIDAMLPPGEGSLVERIAERTGIRPDGRVMARLEWAGLLSDRPLPGNRISPLDIVTERLQRLMAYRSGERDLVVLQHEFIATWPERPTELIISKLVAYGETGGDSAMSLTVSLPAAIAARRLVEKQLRLTGVRIPVHAEIYNPVMDELQSMGIRFEERRHMLLPGPFREWETIPGPKIPADFTG
jgi:saccharopine dehydrogenase-like NADP-dependent oxidoreductase